MDGRLAQQLLGDPQGRGVLTMRARMRERGMSIIEIVVTIAIIGILMALAAPSAAHWIQNTQLRNAAESIYNALQSARLEALKRNTTVSFQMNDANTTAWQVCLYDVINNVCQAGPAAILSEKPASEGSPNAKAGAETVLTTPATGINAGVGLPGSTTFDSLGRLATTAPAHLVRIDVRNPQMDPNFERRLVILVSVGGQIRMCDPKLSLAASPMGCI